LGFVFVHCESVDTGSGGFSALPCSVDYIDHFCGLPLSLSMLSPFLGSSGRSARYVHGCVFDVQIEVKFVGWRGRGGERLGEVTEKQEKKVQGE
jgi:hypothetical protein